MANIAYFQVPADDVLRAKKFYQSLPGWEIEPDTMLQDSPCSGRTSLPVNPWWGTMNAGGLYKRMGPVRS